MSAEDLSRLAMQQAATHAIIITDPEGRIVAWQGGAETILGYKANEILGRPLSELFVPEDREKRLPELELEMAAKSGEGSDDRWQLRKDGGRIWVNGAVTPLRDDSGQLLGFLKILRNRTDLKTQVESLETRLDHLIRQESHKNAFIAGLAHDLRNPLVALNFCVAMISQKQRARADISSTLTQMEREIEFVDRLIGNLLDSTRSAAGKIRLQYQCVDFQELVREAVHSFGQCERVSIQVIMPDIPILTDIDPTRMRQVVANLVDNALKHTPSGSIWIKVSIDGENVTLKVEDTGQGIAPDFLPHIFNLFTQAEAESEVSRGLGIGLSLTRDIVLLHKGTIQATSDGLGKGSVFIISFPQRSSTSAACTRWRTAHEKATMRLDRLVASFRPSLAVIRTVRGQI